VLVEQKGRHFAELSSRGKSWLAEGTKSSRLLVLPILVLLGLFWWLLMSCKHILGWLLSTKLLLLSGLPMLVLLRRLSEQLLLLCRLSKCTTKTYKGNSKSEGVCPPGVTGLDSTNDQQNLPSFNSSHASLTASLTKQVNLVGRLGWIDNVLVALQIGLKIVGIFENVQGVPLYI
jgi:hypothetical protein